MKKQRVLFVCMGNICRSPTAEAVARQMAKNGNLGEWLEFDSAGTHGYHIGEPPDRRAIAAGAKRGYDLAKLRARKVDVADFSCFDLVLAMDDANVGFLTEMCPQEHRHRLQRLLDFAPISSVREVPDPYYGNPEGFDRVIDLIEEGVTGLLSKLK
jgi:protein-tyrosine phosphatase